MTILTCKTCINSYDVNKLKKKHGPQALWIYKYCNFICAIKYCSKCNNEIEIKRKDYYHKGVYSSPTGLTAVCGACDAVKTKKISNILKKQYDPSYDSALED